jgi:hypothetical protein
VTLPRKKVNINILYDLLLMGRPKLIICHPKLIICQQNQLCSPKLF